MDLKDIFKIIGDGPDNEGSMRLRETLETLRVRLESDATDVSEGEIIEGVRKQFELVSSSDFLDEASWLMKALHFTTEPISTEEIQTAWETYQLGHRDIQSFGYDEWPILEGIADWYIQHLKDPESDDSTMVRRSLAVKEYLVQQIRGSEADSEYEDILAGNGLSILYGYCGLKHFERAKFYAQLLQMEHKAGRLSDEDYAEVTENYEYILRVENKPESDRDQVIKLLEDTVSDRERRIQQRDEEIQELEGLLREAEANLKKSHQADLVQAGKDLAQKFGLYWPKLHPDTRKHLELGYVFAQDLLRHSYTFVIPWALFKAVNTELEHRLFQPHTCLERSILERNKNRGTTLVRLLIQYASHAPFIADSDRRAIQLALGTLGGEVRVLSHRDVSRLKIMNDHRNWCEHPDQLNHYSRAKLENYLKDVWSNNWLVEYLRKLAAS